MNKTATSTHIPRRSLAAPTAPGLAAGSPGVPSTDAPEQAYGHRYDQMAKAASSSLMTHHHIEAATVEITGASPELVFHLRCMLIPQVDPSEVMELITDDIIPNAEKILRESFASRDLCFSFKSGQ